MVYYFRLIELGKDELNFWEKTKNWSEYVIYAFRVLGCILLFY